MVGGYFEVHGELGDRALRAQPLQTVHTAVELERLDP